MPVARVGVRETYGRVLAPSLCLFGPPCPPCSLTREGPGTEQALNSHRVSSWGLTALCGSILGRSMAMVMQLRKMMTRTTWSNILCVMMR